MYFMILSPAMFFLRNSLRPDSIDLLFVGFSCAFMKWETENNFFSQIIVFSGKLWPVFPFIFIFYLFRPFQMGPGKILETTNQLSLALKHDFRIFFIHNYTPCFIKGGGSLYQNIDFKTDPILLEVFILFTFIEYCIVSNFLAPLFSPFSIQTL